MILVEIRQDRNRQDNQIVSRAISSDKAIDIFVAAGLKKPDISILSDEFLVEVKHLPQRSLAVELLQQLLDNEPKNRNSFAAKRHKRRKNMGRFEISANDLGFIQRVKPGCLPFRG